MNSSHSPVTGLREAIRNNYSADEGRVMADLLAQIRLDAVKSLNLPFNDELFEL